ncbi:MAG: hypothetical protein AAF376_02535 [Pseudomonadota bacterium]
MTDDDAIRQLATLIEAEQRPLPPQAQEVSAAIRARHGDAVQAMIFYGSALRDLDDPKKMLDFYVIVDRYGAIYRNPLLRLATWLLPPGVHFLQIETETGKRLRCKYAVVSQTAFRRRVSGGLESMLWARFVQPAMIEAEGPEQHRMIVEVFAHACLHFYRQSAPLVGSTTDPTEVWVRGLAESYRTELRPETPDARARDIVDRFPDRYVAFSAILAETAHASATGLQTTLCKLKWLLRRILGKPRGAARVLKGALTFDGGLDYLLEKVGSHSGVEIPISDRARRHPILFAPVIAFRLYRAGAFR